MYGRMQESGHIEGILLIYILAMWNQCPLLFHSESLGIASLGVAAVAEGLSFINSYEFEGKKHIIGII